MLRLAACVLGPPDRARRPRPRRSTSARRPREQTARGRLAASPDACARSRRAYESHRAAVSDERVCRQRAVAGGRDCSRRRFGQSARPRRDRRQAERLLDVAEAGVSVEPARQARRRASRRSDSAAPAPPAPSARPPAPAPHTPPASPPVPTTLPALGTSGRRASDHAHAAAARRAHHDRVQRGSGVHRRPRREPGPRVLRLRQRDARRDVARRSRADAAAVRSSRRVRVGRHPTTA